MYLCGGSSQLEQQILQVTLLLMSSGEDYRLVSSLGDAVAGKFRQRSDCHEQ